MPDQAPERGLAFDQAHDIVYVNTSSAIHLVTLIKQKNFNATQEKFFDKEVSPNDGAPFGMMRQTLLSPIGMPCNPPPWGQLHAVDMHSGNVISNKPVKVKLLNGFLDANRLEISENGAVIRFDGGVSMTLHPDQDPDKAKTQ